MKPSPSIDAVLLELVQLFETRGWLTLRQIGSRQPDHQHPDPKPNELLKPRDAARVLCVASKTLAQWRVSGNGPRFSKVGRNVVYRHADLIDFADQNSRTSTSDGGKR